MKKGNFLLRDSTRVSISLATFIMVIFAIIGFGFTLGTWRAQMDAADAMLESKITVESKQRKADVDRIDGKLEEVQPMLIENQKDMASIKTDLEWLKATQVQILEKLSREE